MQGGDAANGGQHRKRSKLEEIMERDQAAQKAKAERASTNGAVGATGRQDPPWLMPGITVKVWALSCQA